MTDWFETLPGLRDRLWTAMAEAGAGTPPTLATTSAEGWPEARTVILRRVDPEAGRLEVHTDLQSGKIGALAAAPRAALHLWQPAIDLQVRLRCEVEVLTGDEAAERWAAVPEAARGNYGMRPAPGTRIDSALDYARVPDREAFAVLQLIVDEIDAVHLVEPHRRAGFLRADGFAGFWKAP